MKIKNSWILFSMLIGFGYDLWRGGWNGTAFFISGTGIPLVVLGWLFYFRMLGSGDIKLFCVLGGIMGPVHILWCIWYAFLLWSSIFVTLMANKIGGLQFGIYRNCQISSRVFHTAVAALPLTKANRSDFE